MNIFASDVYRLRKGAAARNTLIGLIITIVFLAGTLYMSSSNGFQIYLDETAAAQGANASEIQDMRDDFAEIDEAVPKSAAEFTAEMVSSNLLVFFILPFIIAIFCADFNNGTHRNTLSHESSRKKVYLQKLLLCVCACLALNLCTVVLSVLVGGVLFGFGGLTAAFWLQMLIVILLTLPSQLGVIGFGYLLVAFFKKSSSVIAIYLVGLTVLTMILQTVSMLPGLGWLGLLDWNAVGKLMLGYQAMSAGQILLSVVAGLAIAAGTSAAGLVHYQKADMA